MSARRLRFLLGVVVPVSALAIGCGSEGASTTGTTSGAGGATTSSTTTGAGGAGGGTTTGTGGDGGGGGMMAAKATVTGEARTPAGTAIEGATVKYGAVTATTNDKGVFTIEVPKDAETTLVIEKAGYAPSIQPVKPKGSDTATVIATLHAYTTTTMVDLTMGPATVPLAGKDGAQVGTIELPQNGMVKPSDGTAPAGPVKVETVYIPPEDAVAEAPLPMVAVEMGNEVPLQSHGMVEVTVTSEGEKLQIADGKTAELTLPAAPMDPPTAPLWYGGLPPEETGWIEAGTATNDGTQWNASVPHFSWINIDTKVIVPVDQRACVRFEVTDKAGKPLPGIKLLAESATTNIGYLWGNSGPDGSACYDQFPKTDSVKIRYWGSLIPGAPTPGGIL